nr:glycosyltransferase [uncultured Oscillibacter sp.]
MVSIYRVEKWLDACLQSLLNCNLQDCEILLSLKNSQDPCYPICFGYQTQYDCVSLLFQNGTGLSNARNCGLQQAKGDYLLFVDGDDFVDSGQFSVLLEQLRDGTLDGDVVVTDFFRFVCSSSTAEPVFQIGEQTKPQRGMEFFPTMLRRRQAFWNVWRCLYKRTFLEEHQLYFKENLLCEDIEFTTRVLLSNPAVMFIHCPYYYYRIGRENSLMARPSFARLQNTIWALEQSIARMRQSEFPYANAVIAQYQYEYLLNTAMIFEVERDARPRAAALFSQYRLVMADSQDPLINGMRKAISILGIHCIGMALHTVKQGRRKLR